MFCFENKVNSEEPEESLQEEVSLVKNPLLSRYKELEQKNFNQLLMVENQGSSPSFIKALQDIGEPKQMSRRVPEKVEFSSFSQVG